MNPKPLAVLKTSLFRACDTPDGFHGASKPRLSCAKRRRPIGGVFGRWRKPPAEGRQGVVRRHRRHTARRATDGHSRIHTLRPISSYCLFLHAWTKLSLVVM